MHNIVILSLHHEDQLPYVSIFIFKGVLEGVKKNQEEPTLFTEENLSIETNDRKLKTETEEDDSLSDDEGTCI